ncbi:MAG: PAS domain S-box protein [Pedobacter sp.]|nr:MAG: PAS domain S-box protein [Pedobacter sp.]
MKLKYWFDHLIGPVDEFSMENRTYNAVNLITLALLCGFFIINVTLHQYLLLKITCTVIILQSCFFYFSRFRQRFKASIIVNAIISYIAIISVFIFNEGINGPNIFLFFLTFQLLIAATHKSLHKVWIVLHILIVAALLFIDFRYPPFIRVTYQFRKDRYIDFFGTYVTVMVMIYFITIYLRSHFELEKKRAEERAQKILDQKLLTQNSEAKLRAFFNSSSSCYVLIGKQLEVLDFNNASLTFLREVYGIDIAYGNKMRDFINEAYKERFVANCGKALLGQRSIEELQLHYEDKRIWWQIAYEPAYDNWNNVLGLSFTATNINERKHQEEKINDRNQALSKIAYMQSHDFRGPVASILGLMNMIREQDYQASKEYLKLLEEAAKDLDEKIHAVVKQTDELL